VAGEKGYVKIDGLNVWFDDFQAIRDLSLEVRRNEVTALIGPSGCGKSTVLKVLNRMAEISRGFRLEGSVTVDGHDIYEAEVDPMLVRRQIGMVFQKPNPYPTSIYDNVAWGVQMHGVPRKEIPEIVEASLQKAALWDDVKDRLKKNAFELSGGQQQRLCIARALAVKPEIVLMDEPTSALDPITEKQIEELIVDLKDEYTIVMASHNLNQVARTADYIGFMMIDKERAGYLEMFADTWDTFMKMDNANVKEFTMGTYSEWKDLASY
jgi:phosphate transport system ATP-binding protein